MLTPLLTRLAACVLLPAAAAVLGYRACSAADWPWYVAPAASAYLFLCLKPAGAAACREFFAGQPATMVTWREATQFLARHTLWHSAPWAAAAAAYAAFPHLWPDRVRLADPRWPRALGEVSAELRLSWHWLVFHATPESVHAVRCLFAFAAHLAFVGAERQVEAMSSRPDNHVRGRKEIRAEQAEARADGARPPGDPGILFGAVLVATARAVLHFLFLGAPGSGKSLLIQLIMQRALPEVREGSDTRALVYDHKGELLSLLAAMGVPFKSLNMFDARSVAWDMAQDVTDEVLAGAVVEVLFPPNERASQPFFDDAARALAKAVIVSFIECNPGAWTFRDVVFTLRSKERIRRVLERTPEGREVLALYFANEKVLLDVMSTVANKTDPYVAIAAAFDSAGEKVSLRDWAEGSYVLVLGNSHVARPSVKAMNEAIFKRLSQLLLEQPTSRTRRTWIFLDELRQAGRLDGLNALAVEGRSRGVVLVLGTQDVEGLRAVYGEEEADELLGVVGNKALLRVASPETAKWASDVVGEQEVMEVGVTTSERGGASWSEQRVKREAVLPSQLLDLPPTDPANGLHGYYLSPGIGCWRATLSGDYLTRTLVPADPGTPDRVERPREQLRLRPWTEEEAKALGLSLTPEPGAGPAPGLEPRRTLKAMALKRLAEQETSPGQR
ncbi:MAG: type IV secretion system DNA-binding domain-containing protein [Gemmataceae bacterium]